MIKDIDFIINDSNPVPSDKWIGAFAISSNIIKRIKDLSRLKYKKWEIVVSDGDTKKSKVEYEDSAFLRMELFVEFTQVNNCKESGSVASLYRLIFDSLLVVWKEKLWPEEEIKKIHSDIINEKYRSFIIWGKKLQTKDKKYTAELYCELYPDYADLYVEFTNKGELVRRIKFLKAHLDPDMFYGFFAYQYWRDNEYFFITDVNREILYVFNVHKNDFLIEYKPVYNTQGQLEKYVKAFRFDVPGYEATRLLGLAGGIGK